MRKVNNNKFICIFLAGMVFGAAFFLVKSSGSTNNLSQLSQTAKSVVKINLYDGFGSGTIVGKSTVENGFIYYVLTVAHLYDPVEITEFSIEQMRNYLSEKMFPTERSLLTIISYFPDGSVLEASKADILCHNRDSDVMILTFYSQEEYDVVKISKKYNVTDTVYSISYQLGLGLLLTDGLISRIDDQYIFSSDPIAPGASGGGLFTFHNNELCLIGMIHAMGAHGIATYPHISWNIRSKTFLYYLILNNVPVEME